MERLITCPTEAASRGGAESQPGSRAALINLGLPLMEGLARGPPPRPGGHLEPNPPFWGLLCALRDPGHHPLDAEHAPSPLTGCDNQPCLLTLPSVGCGTLPVDSTALEGSLLIILHRASCHRPSHRRGWRPRRAGLSSSPRLFCSPGLHEGGVVLGVLYPKVLKRVGATQSRGMSISRHSSLQPECEMPGEPWGKAAGVGGMGWGLADRGAEDEGLGLPLEGGEGPREL